MSKINIQSCRVCLINIGDTSIYENYGEEKLSEMIEFCTNLKIPDNDGYLASICYDCIEKLHIAYKFKQECEASDEIMRNLFTIKYVTDVDPIGTNSELDKVYNLDEETTTRTNEKTTFIETLNRKLKDTSVCSVIVKKENKMNTEENITKNKINENECDICHSVYVSTTTLMVHKSNMHGIFTCEICSKEFTSIIDHDNHQQAHTDLKNTLICEFCDKGFKNKNELLCHLLLHSDERPYSCKYCEINFNVGACLNTHEIKAHNIIPHTCDICDLKFSRLFHFKMHRMIHDGTIKSGDNVFKCGYCDKEFNSYRTLEIHLKIHKVDKTLKCPTCNRIFAHIQYLRRHQRRGTCTSNKKPYKCLICMSTFMEYRNMKKHVKKFHFNDADNKANIAETSNTEKQDQELKE